MRLPRIALAGALAVGAAWPCAADTPASDLTEPSTVAVFHDVVLHFNPDSLAKFAQPGTTAEDQGRVVRARRILPTFSGSQRILALVTLKPIPKSEREVHDHIDRAGNVRLLTPGLPDLGRFRVEDVRPKDAKGGFGYWRISAHLVGWKEMPNLWHND